MSLKRTIYRLSFHVFKLFSRAGIYILPAHYYVPIADVNRLEKTKEAWAVKSSLPGVYSNLDEQAGSKKFACRFKRSMNVTTSIKRRSVNILVRVTGILKHRLRMYICGTFVLKRALNWGV